MKLTKGVVTGIIVGAMASAISVPMMNNKSKRKIMRHSKKMRNTAEKAVEHMINKMF